MWVCVGGGGGMCVCVFLCLFGCRCGGVCGGAGVWQTVDIQMKSWNGGHLRTSLADPGFH